MAEKYISLSEAHRRYGVALSTLRRKLGSGELIRAPEKDGGGVTVASLKKLYGAPSEEAKKGVERSMERSRARGGALHGARVERSRSAPWSDEGAIPPEHVAELASIRAERDTLKATLDHERADREAERKAWGDKYEKLAQSLIAVKAADYARDTLELKDGNEKPVSGEIIEHERAEKPRPKPDGRGGKYHHTKKPKDTPTVPPRPSGLGRGLFAKWWGRLTKR